MSDDGTALSPGVNVRLALLALSAAYFFIGATSLGVIGLVVEMGEALDVSASLIAALVTVFAVVYALAAPGLQALLGGLPRRNLICSGLVLVAASCFLCAVATDYATVLLARAGMAIGAAMTGPTASAAGAAMVPPERRARALAAVFAGLTLSTVLGIPTMSFLGQVIGWRWSWAAVGIAALAVAPLVWAMVPASNRGAKATLSALIGVLRDSAIALTVSTTAVQIAGQFVLFALLAAWLVEYLGTSLRVVPLVLLLFGIGGVVGNALSSFVEQKLGAENTVQSAILVMAVSILAMGLIPHWPLFALALAVVWSVSGLAIMAPLQSRLVRLEPARVNLALALNASAIYVGMSTGSAAAGLLYDGFGVAVLPFVAAAVIALSLLVFRASLTR